MVTNHTWFCTRYSNLVRNNWRPARDDRSTALWELTVQHILVSDIKG
jgi:hypothetical protein